ncbi:MAG: peptidoglycan-binding protein [Bryobacteraceae bacterium]
MLALSTPLVAISIASIYDDGPLPDRMALCTPDTKKAIEAASADLVSLGFGLRLSDLFRSYEMQKQAHADYLQGRKGAFSPAPGGSMHEAGRAMDIDLSSIGVPLSKFWEIAHARGFLPIIDKPDASRSESWHFDCRGSHSFVYDYVKSGKAGTALPPYTQMAQSSILAIGVNLDSVPAQDVAYIQSTLIRLGFDPGRIDGITGERTREAAKEAGIDLDSPFETLSRMLQATFASEYPDQIP